MAPDVPVLRFGTDGVRGVAYEDLTAESVHALGRAAARVLGTDRHFLVAPDSRVSRATRKCRSVPSTRAAARPRAWTDSAVRSS